MIRVVANVWDDDPGSQIRAALGGSWGLSEQAAGSVMLVWVHDRASLTSEQRAALSALVDALGWFEQEV